MALLGDIVLASSDAVFRPGFTRLGAVPDNALAYTLPRLVGPMIAKDILLADREVTAAEALTMGLVSRVSAPDRLLSDARALAARLAAGAGTALGLTKMLVDRGAGMGLEAFLELEAAYQGIAFATPDFDEGVAAARQRRKPSFSA